MKKNLLLISLVSCFIFACKEEKPQVAPQLPVTKSSELSNLTNQKSQEFDVSPTEDCDKKPSPKPVAEPVDLTKKADAGCTLK